MSNTSQFIDAARHDIGLGIRVLNPEHLIKLVARECISLAEIELHQAGDIAAVIDHIKRKFDIN